MLAIRKYPRTHHLEGSRLQPGDEDLSQVPFAAIRDRNLVVEEKVDGANAGLRFDQEGRLFLQSRGHFLTGGPRERQFPLFKQWANAHARDLHEILGSRFVLFGEWMYAKHTVFYDHLPHYFLEFDVLDLEMGEYLSTPRRRHLLEGLPVVSVPVLHEGPAQSLDQLLRLIGPSHLRSPQWRQALDRAARAEGLDPDTVRTETDPHDEMEGLYLKVEEEGRVVERLKWVRASFLTSILDSGSHWMKRPILPNQLRAGVNLFEM